ncbi:hypothetical protein L208DRAFT_1215699, partial [Tricholoma matsutake]
SIEQERALAIIHNHLEAYLAAKNPPQLLLMILGQGGTGKSQLIRAITDMFDQCGALELLGKTATSGVAASLIGGQTLHSWAGI